LLQSRPERLALSILVVDAASPWGSGWCPPAGDLRASRERLLAAADLVLAHSSASSASSASHPGKPIHFWSSRLTGARSATGGHVSLDELRTLRLGLVLALARPERVEQQLARSALAPRIVRLCSDHARPEPGFRLRPSARARRGVDAWLTTAKCASKLGSSFAGAPLLVLEQAVTLPVSVLETAELLARRGAP
jgi:tetraacyldisaccharide-1-P 4'-kinase